MPPSPIWAVASYGPRRVPGVKDMAFSGCVEADYNPGRDLLEEVHVAEEV